MLPAKLLLLFCQKNGLQAYIMSALLWCCLSNWHIQSFNIALCAVLVLCHRNRMGNLSSISKNQNLGSFRKSAWSPIFLQCIMLAHQAALIIQGSTSIEAINNNRKPGLINQNISEMSWCVPLFCTLWIWLWCHIDTWKSLNCLSWQSY